MISFACDICGKQLKAKDKLAGKKGKCPHCGHSMAVPAVAKDAHAQANPSDPEKKKTQRRKAFGQVETESLSGDAEQTAFEAGGQGQETPSSPAETPEQPLWDFLAPPEKPDEIGRLGIYRVLKVLGAGGMGVVFRAEDPQLERLVALKAILPSKISHPNAKMRFFREAKVVAALKHPHIVTIYQIGEHRGAPFLAMEFLEGESLEDRLRGGDKLALSEILRIGREIAEGLAAAHEKGRIHRDIKPANLWLEGKDGRVKILDFGLACVLGDETHLTQSGTVVGTPAYMAPEQASGKKVDSRCDLFSLGCVLYYMCTGERPFKGNDTISILSALALKTPPPPVSLNSRLPSELSDLVMHLLAKKPKDRPESAGVVAERLQAIERRITTATAAPGRKTAEVKESGPRRRRSEASRNRTEVSVQRSVPLAWLVAGGLAGLGAVLVLIFFLILSGTNSIQPSDNRTNAVVPLGNANDERKPSTEPESPIKTKPKAEVAEELPAIPVEFFANIKKNVDDNRLMETTLAGKRTSHLYRDVHKDGGILIGFEVGGTDSIDALRPIYLTKDGEQKAEWIGKPPAKPVSIKARPGYVVGQLTVCYGDTIVNLSVKFVKLAKDRLDPGDTYASELIGGKGGTPITIGAANEFYLGIYGCRRASGEAPCSLGLITLERRPPSPAPTPKPPPIDVAVDPLPGDLFAKIEPIERTVHLKASVIVGLSIAQGGTVSSQTTELDLLETLFADPLGARVAIGFGPPSLISTVDGKKTEAPQQVKLLVQSLPPWFVIDNTNKLRNRTDRKPSSKLNQDIILQVKNHLTTICNAYEATHFVLPNRQLNPQETWNVKLPMLVPAETKPELADLALTCTYEGVRTATDGPELLVSFHGTAAGRSGLKNKLNGKVSGKFIFDSKRGFISFVTISISTETSVPGGQYRFSFNVDLTRREGNPLNLQLPPNSKPPPPFVGDVVLTENNALTTKDPVDKKLGQNKRAKTFSIELQEGKKYSIQLNSNAFDAYLRLISPIGQIVAEDDDSGGGLNSRIDFTAAVGGQYTIVCTSVDGKLGKFQLNVFVEKGSPKLVRAKQRIQPFPERRAFFVSAAGELKVSPIIEQALLALVYRQVLA